ncbi:chitinase [Arthrobacter sp. HMWF013]|uniref:chitinase n=1 Tax=Arthrobacter sp. HMWF013 TaxID=2056849 RepID=UPI000D367A17|nr:chitinase [Arthrobacter sp. HMWF013]PTT62640.1 glycosyl hydrolase [Arthrobacter sp. HMWF013]
MPASMWRGTVAVGLAAALSLSGCAPVREANGREEKVSQAGPDTRWFGGYLDVTIVPGPGLQNVPSPGKATTVLSFVTANPVKPCEASWGGSYDLEQANSRLDLDSQVDAFRKAGNDVAVSFGGQLGKELAVACTDDAALMRAYAGVIDRYGLATVDLDVEGASAADPAAAERRADTMARLPGSRPPDAPLKIWLTLPVSVQGLTPAAIVSLETMIAAGVELAGVNLMTMNFGPLPQGQSMLDASIRAAEGSHRALAGVYERAGKPLQAEALWRKIGLTPMIGQNDVPDQVFTPADAEGLNAFARERGVGRMSMWSLNRDISCNSLGQVQPAGVATHSCSGLEGRPGMFTEALSKGFVDTDSSAGR